MNWSNALALAFALFIACLPINGVADAAPSRRVRTAPASGPTQTPSQGVTTLPKVNAPPRVTNDSDGLSRDPEDCNKGCLGSSE